MKEVTKILINKGMCEKMTFYNSLEDKFKAIRNNSYIPDVTMLYFELKYKVAHAVAKQILNRISYRFKELIGDLV